nr:hypothetical protein [Arthrobacter woluwensis]
MLLEDDLGLRPSEVRVRPEMELDEVPERGNALAGDVEHEVVVPADQVDALNPRDRPEAVGDDGQPVSHGAVHADEDHRLDAGPDRLGVDVGVVAADGARFFEGPHAAVARGPRKSHAGGELLVGQPPVAAEFGEDPAVGRGELNSVHGTAFRESRDSTVKRLMERILNSVRNSRSEIGGLRDLIRTG